MSIEYVSKGFEAKIEELPWQKLGLTWTATGYGRKIPSSRMIKLHGESIWRRVYVVCYSNAGSSYVVVKGKPTYIRDCDWPINF